MDKRYELSHPQKRILMTHLMYENTPVCNIGGYVCFRGAVDFGKLIDAIRKAIKSMDCFQIYLSKNVEGYTQYFIDEEPEIEKLIIEDVYNAENVLQNKAKEVLGIPFILEDRPLFRIIAFSAGDGLAGYILCCHHIILDGWSVKLFTGNVSAFYNDDAVHMGTYADYLDVEKEYLQSERSNKDKEYWDNFIQRHNLTALPAKDENECNGVREEIKVDADTQILFSNAAKVCGGENAFLASCFILMDYLRDGTGVVDLPNFNRIGHRMRETGGMFTSTVLAGISLSPDMKMYDIPKSMHREMYSAIRHQQWPYNLINLGSKKEVFRYSINYYNTDISQSIGQVSGEYHEVYPGVQAVPFQVILKKWGKIHSLSFDMRKDYYCSGDSVAIYRFIIDFAKSITESQEETIGEFAAKLAARESKVQNRSFEVDQIQQISISDRLQRVLYPEEEEKQAVIMLESTLLNRKEFSELVAGAMRRLEEAGVTTGDRALFWLSNSLEYLVYVYAAIVKGVIFIPVDVGCSVQQLRYIYQNAGGDIVITKENKAHEGIRILYPDLQKANITCIQNINENLTAYILYTSGTTGYPKGVLISRKALASYLNWAEKVYGCENYFMYSSPSFDLSITTLFLPLTSGGKLVIAENDQAYLYRIQNHMHQDKITALKATPSNLEILLARDTPGLKLRVIICGGEELSISLAERLQKRFGPQCHIYNEYGPTEGTVGCMCYLYDKNRDKAASVPIGMAAPGCRIYVVGENGKLCSTGKSGEIYLEGSQLADGYWNLPEENNKRFISDFLAESRVYRTGDIGRYCEDGNVEYLGRMGRQCKVNGYRIELEGIERVLRRVSGIRNAAVWVTEKQQICAAVDTSIYTERELVNCLQNELPAYSIPQHFLLCDGMPVTRNGKLNAKVLNNMLTVQIQEKTQINIPKAKRNERKRQVLEETVREALNYNGEIEEFNYLIAGGDSIQALRIINQLDRFGYHLSLADLLDQPDFEGIISCMKENDPEVEEQLLKRMSYPLPVHLKYLEQSCSEFMDYRQIMILNMPGYVSRDQACQLIQKLCEMLPSLNAIYQNSEVYEEYGIPEIEWIDDTKRKGDFSKWCSWLPADKKERLFHLAVCAGEESSFIRLTAHHILIDGTSWYQLIRAVADILSGKKVIKHSFMNITRLDTLLNYKWSSLSCHCDSPYCVLKKSVSVSSFLKNTDFFEMVKNAAAKEDQIKDYTLLFDWNGRELLDNNRTDQLGCYSVFVPVKVTGVSVEEEIQKRLEDRIIELPDNKCMRINFLGNLANFFHETPFAGIGEYAVKSVEYSMRQCSAFGCNAEVTAFILESDFGAKLHVYLTKRNNVLGAENAKVFLDRLTDELTGSLDKQALWWGEDVQRSLQESIEQDELAL